MTIAETTAQETNIASKDIQIQVAKETGIKVTQVEKVLDLLNEGNTIPFIARYRKEMTGNLDEVQIFEIQKRYTYVTQLEERRLEVSRLIEEQDKLTDQLQGAIQQAQTLQQLEDIYRPFKQKRRTKAMIAIEQGLEPLAMWLISNEDDTSLPLDYAQAFVNEVVESAEVAIAGAQEIIAQLVSDRADFREFIRKYTRYNANLVTQLKDETKDIKQVYQLYYEFTGPLHKLPEYRILAINRAEKEEVISVKIQVEEGPIYHYLNQRFIEAAIPQQQQAIVEQAIVDAYKRFIGPAIEREMRQEATQKADAQAIRVFGENLKHLLLATPLKGKIVLGFDPAYRTGCKLAIIDPTGKVLGKAVIYPHKPASEAKRQQAQADLIELIRHYKVEVIAIGNGTASRESEQFVAQAIKEGKLAAKYLVISEAGASVYSASELAREEFPDFQVEERSAVSIARRLQDPLAELIKIDPKSIGVGQYQHDVAQKQLNEELDFVVHTTVNKVGVDVNTASASLLQHISGLSVSTAKNIVALRNELGAFKDRKQIKQVKRLGPKTYEQAIGFMRIANGTNPLDQTSIHPESYDLAQRIVSQAGLNLTQLGTDGFNEALDQLDLNQISQQMAQPNQTLKDIIQALKTPMSDIREGGPMPQLREDVMTFEDLVIGMKLQGIVRNVVDFGAFVDIGLKHDGLIHKSKLLNYKGQHPSKLVAVGDIVEVEVIDKQEQTQRIGLKQLKSIAK